MASFRDWLALTRFEHSLMVFFAIVIAQAIVASGFSPAFLLPAIGPLFITAGAFAYNDYCGYKTDAANKRLDRPIVAGRISRASALYASALFYALGIGFCALLNSLAFAIAFAYAAASLFYDSFLKKLPVVGNAFIASTMSIAFIYANVASTNSFAGLNSFIIIFAAMAFLAGLGREFLITLRDVKGDKKVGVRSLPMIIGARATITLAGILVIAAVALSLLPVIETLFLPYALLIGLADGLFLVTLFNLAREGKSFLKQARDYTLYGSVIGLIAFASLAFA